LEVQVQEVFEVPAGSPGFPVMDFQSVLLEVQEVLEVLGSPGSRKSWKSMEVHGSPRKSWKSWKSSGSEVQEVLDSSLPEQCTTFFLKIKKVL